MSYAKPLEFHERKSVDKASKAWKMDGNGCDSGLEEPPVEGRRRSVSPAMGDFIKAHTVQINKHEEKKKGRTPGL